MTAWTDAIGRTLDGERLDAAGALALLDAPLPELTAAARELRQRGKGTVVTYSPKVFIPLTKLCRDVCHYCTFARPPRRGERAYLTPDEVLRDRRAPARRPAATRRSSRSATSRSCATAAARDELARARLRDDDRVPRPALRELVLEETGLLPHVNPGVHDARRARGAAAGLGLAGDHARDAVRAALGSAAARTGPRPTSCRRRGSRRSRRPASSRSRSRPGS